MRKIAALALVAILTLALAGCDQQNQGQAPIQTPQGSHTPPNLNNKIDSLNTILKKDPGNLNAQVDLGNAYMDTGQFEKASAAYIKALEINPGLSNVRTDLGTCQRRSGKPDLAAASFREAIRIDPRHPYAHMNLGVVLAYDLGDLDGAIKAFETFLELAPTDPNAQAVRAEIQRLKAVSGSQPAPKS